MPTMKHRPLSPSPALPVPGRQTLAIALLPLAGAALLALSAALPRWAHAEAPAGALAVPVVPVGTLKGGGAWSLDATIEAVRQSTIGAQASGNVVALKVRAGDTVKAGQELARIDARETQAGLSQSEAAVAQADARLRDARASYARTQDLRSQGYVSSAALDAAKAQLDAAAAARSQAAAGQTQAALARQFTSVVAPYDGVIATTAVQPGDLAVPGRAIVTMYAPQPLRATVQLPLSQAAASDPARVRITLAGGQSVKPESLSLLPAADPVAQTREWRLALPAGTQAVPGQSVSVEVEGEAPTGATPRLAVPARAILTRGELSAVYLARDGQFVLRAVRLGPAVGDQRTVLAGLKAGDKVAADGVRAGLAGAVPAAQ